MSDVQTVTLELLRHGPANNQLLSPLTQYLALCGDQGAETLTVPFEHQQFLREVKELRYDRGRGDRQYWLTRMARTMSDVLGRVTALPVELAASRGAGLLNLELVLSASELALLPFELADSLGSLPGSGHALQLQPQSPLTITRRVRRVSNKEFEWPSEFRILFAAAAPSGVGSIPIEEHLLALRAAIEPWLHYFDPDDAAARRKAIEEHLVVIPRASVAAIERACRAGAFTHVHILAHGLPDREADETRFGIALHDGRDPSAMEVVDGKQLATALRTYRAGADDELSAPAVVTIASCDAANVGSVIGAGASVAHALHENGIPLVVASQFPLSFAGSVLMTQTLYEQLLAGADPRRALSDLRRRLHANVPGTHDWASIVAYGAFPVDFEEQLDFVRTKQADGRVNAALSRADAAISRVQRGKATGDPRPALERALAKLSESREALKHLKPSGETVGLLASAYKREAQILYQVSKLPGGGEEYLKRSKDALRSALEQYENAAKAGGAMSHWVLVQHICLAALLGATNGQESDVWIAARFAAQSDLESPDQETRAWAHASLAELYLLSALLPLPSQLSPEETRKAVDLHMRELVAQHTWPFQLKSTARQFWRYVEWFPDVGGDVFKEKIAPMAKATLDTLSKRSR